MKQENINLYVFTNYDNKVIGTYEEEEIKEFFNDYTLECATEIQNNYSVRTQLYYHLRDLGELACFYDRDYIDLINNKDIDEFLDIYNELTQEPLQVDRIVVNDEVEEQDFIEYINNIENGFQKYKDNSYSIPTTKIIVKKTYREMPDLETITIEDEKTEENIEEILCFFLEEEITSLKDDYSTKELLFDKTDYLRSILEISYRLKNKLTSNYNLLYEFKDLYDYEHYFSNSPMIITFK